MPDIITVEVVADRFQALTQKRAAESAAQSGRSSGGWPSPGADFVPLSRGLRAAQS